MRPRLAVIFGLLAGLLAGCASEPIHPTNWLDRFRQGVAPVGPDVVQLDAALIERPIGDKYLNRGLWEFADETIALESKEALTSNGFRVGQIGGITPEGLHDLLRSSRSNSQPRRLQLHAGKPVRLDLGPETAVCQFQLQRDGIAVPVRLEQAQVMLMVVPTLVPDGRIRLRFEPQIQHGQASLLPQPSADHAGWVMKSDRPAEHYAMLNWEVTLAPNEYVVVGGRFEQPQSLGYQGFIRRDERTPVQRLLVIRTNRAMPPSDEVTGLIADPSPAFATPTLAGHASFSANPTARGSSH